MSSYWVGVTTGSCCSIILALITSFSLSSELKETRKELSMIRERQEQIEVWIEDNETVMSTYKFFNESWSAILDMRREDKQ